MSVEENKALIQRFVEGSVSQTLQGDAGTMRDYLTPDFVFHNPVVASSEHHHDKLDQETLAFAEVLPGHGITVDHIIAENDMVAIHFKLRPPSEDEIGAGGTVHYRITDGKIAELWYYSSIGETLQNELPV